MHSNFRDYSLCPFCWIKRRSPAENQLSSPTNTQCHPTWKDEGMGGRRGEGEGRDGMGEEERGGDGRRGESSSKGWHIQRYNG